MAILVVGSVAFDSIETPHGKVDHCLGGAATHFALAASYFTPVRVIAVVGKDFTAEHEAVLTRRGIDTKGIERSNGLTFHWTGSYSGHMDVAKTLGTDLNVFETFEPKIPDSYKDSEYLFLANIDPVLQALQRVQLRGDPAGHHDLDMIRPLAQFVARPPAAKLRSRRFAPAISLLTACFRPCP